MGVFSGWQSAASSAANVLANLVGQDIVARSISLTQAAASNAVQLVTGARLKLGTGTTDYLISNGTTRVDTGADFRVAGVMSFPSTGSIDGGGVGLRALSNATPVGTWDTGTGDYTQALGDIIMAANGAFRLAAKFAIRTAPTISAGAGAAIVASNGSIGFRVDLGGAAQTGTITLPTATTGWVLYGQNITAPASNVIGQTGTTTTSATFTNYARTTGVAANWAANDNATFIAIAY